jgi:hypothetical protein
MRLLSWLLRRDLVREMILSHEIVHLLQHQAHPELMQPDPFWKTQDDASAASQAALEGDALHYGFAALEVAPPDAEKVRDAIEADGLARERGALAEAPALLRLTLAFPYSYGYGLSLREGRRLLEQPPASTEQVIHAEKRHEPFTVIDLRALAAALPAGCRPAFENTLGELGISVLMRDLGDGLPESAWEGWDGDRWFAASCAGRRELFWLSSWDTPEDAAEFASAYARIAARVAARAGMTSPPAAQVDGRDVFVTTTALGALAPRVGALARRARASGLEELRARFDAATPP